MDQYSDAIRKKSFATVRTMFVNAWVTAYLMAANGKYCQHFLILFALWKYQFTYYKLADNKK